jgi:RNA polymerase sigma-70 factor, ECF subfamily
MAALVGSLEDFRHRSTHPLHYLWQVMDPSAPLRAVPVPDDRELVSRCLAGERAAQRRLFDREKRQVHGTLFRILGSNQQIDDLVQDVFFAVFRGLHTFRGESSLSTWIDRCAVRTAFAHIRSKRGRHHLELVAENLANDDPSAERRTLAREATRHLYDTLEHLDPKYRVAFTLHAIDGRSVAEVAELMQASVVATKARVWRARRFVEKRAKANPALADYLVTASTASPAGKSKERP